jgi:hypothetical protein
MDSSLLAPTTNHFKQVTSQVKLINYNSRLATYAKHVVTQSTIFSIIIFDYQVVII